MGKVSAGSNGCGRREGECSNIFQSRKTKVRICKARQSKMQAFWLRYKGVRLYLIIFSVPEEEGLAGEAVCFLVAMRFLWTITLNCCMFCWLSFKDIQVVWVCEIVCFHVKNILASSSCVLHFIFSLYLCC